MEKKNGINNASVSQKATEKRRKRLKIVTQPVNENRIHHTNTHPVRLDKNTDDTMQTLAHRPKVEVKG